MNESNWYELLKFIGPPGALAIIFFWQYARFANRVLDRVDKREQTLLDFVSNVSATSATNTEICRSLSDDVNGLIRLYHTKKAGEDDVGGPR